MIKRARGFLYGWNDLAFIATHRVHSFPVYGDVYCRIWDAGVSFLLGSISLHSGLYKLAYFYLSSQPDESALADAEIGMADLGSRQSRYVGTNVIHLQIVSVFINSLQ